MFDSLNEGILKSVLSDHTPRALSESDIDQLYMICAAKVTKHNWNELGYTFIITSDEEANWLSIDSLVLSDFLEDASTSVPFYPKYLNLFVAHDSFLDVEILEQSEDNEEEYINEAVFIAEDDVLDALNNSDIRAALLDSIKMTVFDKNPFQEEVVRFISSSLK